ncbi:hypothetical protein Syun_001777 [Stephania yunnanensis]|uniref:Uncharacterized protein n=1 Tax=Stephania yunnanensis TaxID=152371 RepID=A0AAP0LGC2_9MAGN
MVIHNYSLSQGDSVEEFEALFDYSRVQPNFILIDDDNSDSEKTTKLSPKRLKAGKLESCQVVNAIDCDGGKEEEEEDWLKPPPKCSGVVAQKLEVENNTTLKELRLKRQELELFAKSAQDLLRTVEESTPKEATSVVQFASEPGAMKTSRPPEERKKIVISFQDKDELKQFRVFVDEKFSRVLKFMLRDLLLMLISLFFVSDAGVLDVASIVSNHSIENRDIVECTDKDNDLVIHRDKDMDMIHLDQDFNVSVTEEPSSSRRSLARRGGAQLVAEELNLSRRSPACRGGAQPYKVRWGYGLGQYGLGRVWPWAGMALGLQS